MKLLIGLIILINYYLTLKSNGILVNGFPGSYSGCSVSSYTSTDYAKIPESFDFRDKHGDCISPIRDQGSCGSCWAQVSSGILADRMCVGSGGSIKKLLSPQYLLDCDHQCIGASGCNNGCKGGFVGLVLTGLTTSGTVLDECLSYQRSADSTCPTLCDDGSPISNQTVFRASSCMAFPTVQDAQYEIMTNGPVIATFMLYDDFKPHNWDIYIKGSDTKVESHAVRVVGWGTSGGVDYWIAANSWGTDWGSDNGFFKIKRGSNEADFEIGFITVTADVSSVPDSLKGGDYEFGEGGNASSFLKPSLLILFTLIILYLILVPIILS